MISNVDLQLENLLAKLDPETTTSFTLKLELFDHTKDEKHDAEIIQKLMDKISLCKKLKELTILDGLLSSWRHLEGTNIIKLLGCIAKLENITEISIPSVAIDYPKTSYDNMYPQLLEILKPVSNKLCIDTHIKFPDEEKLIQELQNLKKLKLTIELDTFSELDETILSNFFKSLSTVQSIELQFFSDCDIIYPKEPSEQFKKFFNHLKNLESFKKLLTLNIHCISFCVKPRDDVKYNVPYIAFLLNAISSSQSIHSIEFLYDGNFDLTLVLNELRNFKNLQNLTVYFDPEINIREMSQNKEKNWYQPLSVLMKNQLFSLHILQSREEDPPPYDHIHNLIGRLLTPPGGRYEQTFYDPCIEEAIQTSETLKEFYLAPFLLKAPILKAIQANKNITHLGLTHCLLGSPINHGDSLEQIIDDIIEVINNGNITDLNLSHNSLQDFTVITDLLQDNTHLVSLNLANNRLEIPSNQEFSSKQTSIIVERNKERLLITQEMVNYFFHVLQNHPTLQEINFGNNCFNVYNKDQLLLLSKTPKLYRFHCFDMNHERPDIDNIPEEIEKSAITKEMAQDRENNILTMLKYTACFLGSPIKRKQEGTLSVSFSLCLMVAEFQFGKLNGHQRSFLKKWYNERIQKFQAPPKKRSRVEKKKSTPLPLTFSRSANTKDADGDVTMTEKSILSKKSNQG